MYNFKFQIFSAFLGLYGVYLAARQNSLTWTVSLLSGVVSIFIYFDKGLYSKCGFVVFTILNSFYGWYIWTYKNSAGEGIYITRSKYKRLVFYFFLGLASTFIIGELFKGSTNISFWDAFYASYGIIAHWMLANKKLENWIIWIVVDAVFAYVCFVKGLYIMSIKCLIYTVIAIYGYLSWRTHCVREDSDTDDDPI